jgi:ribose 5-phosphate isomerase A
MTSASSAPDLQAPFKRQAAEQAVSFVEAGMTVGLGSGSTALHAVRRIAELLRAGELRDVVGCATSEAVQYEAERLGLPLLSDSLPQAIDLTIDGADEVEPGLDLIKGRGGALLREKIVAQASRRVIIVVDETKLSAVLGARRPVPVEVVPFGWQSSVRYLESLGGQVTLRETREGEPFRTDQGHLLLDCRFGPIADARDLAQRLEARAGLVEHGLFLGLASQVIVAGPSGLCRLRRSHSAP